jgi:hypothetical protein
MGEDIITAGITVADITTIMVTDTDLDTIITMGTDIIMDVDTEPSPDVTGIIETEMNITGTEATEILTTIGIIDPITTDQTTIGITDPTTIDQTITGTIDPTTTDRTITGVVDHTIDPIMVERPDQRSEPDANKPFFFLAYSVRG